MGCGRVRAPPLVAGEKDVVVVAFCSSLSNVMVAGREKKITTAAAPADDLHFLFETFCSVSETRPPTFRAETE